MPIVVMGQTYFRTSEACRLAGIARSTLLRWTSSQVTEDAALRDRRGWRLFTQAEVDSITREAQKSQWNPSLRSSPHTADPAPEGKTSGKSPNR